MPTNPGGMRLSAALITRDEERNLTDCLQSLAFCDEIVIVDSGSTDKTAEIAGHFGAKFSSRPFDNFASQKNEAIRQTSGDWILLLDADERVTPELAKEIQCIIESQPDCDGYWMKRHNYIFGRLMRHGANANDLQLRLVRRGKGLFEGIIHERVVLHGKGGLLRSPLLHYSTRNREDYDKRLAFYTDLEAEKIYRKGIRPNAVDIFLRPVAQFLRFYIFGLGFLDGFAGLQYQCLSSYYIYVKYTKAQERFNNSQPRQEKITV
jgi:glycosyltransferase involved in cell wall biosynthesis